MSYKCIYPCLHLENRSGGKSSFPQLELSFSGDELWVTSDKILTKHTRGSSVRNNPKFIFTKWKFKWWRWTFASTSIFRGGDKGKTEHSLFDLSFNSQFLDCTFTSWLFFFKKKFNWWNANSTYNNDAQTLLLISRVLVKKI